jgi:environmental stress-induced protein Ves
MGDFDWRLSAAKVGGPGPFSSFPGVDRTLLVVDGAGIELRLAGEGSVLVERGGSGFAFAGDAAVTATLPDGPILDLNIMTRRERYRHEIRRVREAGPVGLPPGADLVLVVALDGRAELAAGDRTVGIDKLDTLVIDGDATGLELEGGGDIVVITLIRQGA